MSADPTWRHGAPEGANHVLVSNNGAVHIISNRHFSDPPETTAVIFEEVLPRAEEALACTVVPAGGPSVGMYVIKLLLRRYGPLVVLIAEALLPVCAVLATHPYCFRRVGLSRQ